MKKDTLECVRVFHETYGLPVKDAPHLDDARVNSLRISLLQEELDELKEALEQGDEVGVLDALTDLQYVLDGAYLSLGFHDLKNAAFAEVQRSNMSKLGRDGKPVVRPEDGKILKGPDYTPPDLTMVMETWRASRKKAA
ncbi:MAG: nucleoside triphosphate pyrophosphohydrolase family protein [Rhodospirillales bacterium]|nr:nucleoside triphosphate pyrophosphohydrolase family protein [Alphaproteobacteria bacterium]MCB9986556.1 nucleoside triphosphate pyrophosphohydrolase family protein [Rhodospirillales bacterium]USO08601.1 MAG: nucleoside triphosphate pyrophosphohydrolase family protein [Rhodospirillales bacterium]